MLCINTAAVSIFFIQKVHFGGPGTANIFRHSQIHTHTHTHIFLSSMITITTQLTSTTETLKFELSTVVNFHYEQRQNMKKSCCKWVKDYKTVLFDIIIF